MTIERIVSGGQTGVDRAALDVARKARIPAGGWYPRGRKAEDGKIPRCYGLRETPSRTYALRTEWNVRDSDGTLILTVGGLAGGSALTLGLAQAMQKPCKIVTLDRHPDVAEVVDWLARNSILTLNVAGPRESSQPGIYGRASSFLEELFTASAFEAGRNLPPSPRDVG